MDSHPTVEALLAERSFAVTKGNADLVGLINAELKARGHEDPEDKKPARRARKERAVKESAPERAVDEE